MDDFAAMLASAANVMKFEMTLWGFTFSFWNICLWGMVASVVLYLLWRFFDG